MLKRKNPLRPFEDETQLEFLAECNDTSLFMYVSDSKKRPDNVVLGRLFDHHVLDMIELGVDAYLPMAAIESEKSAEGTVVYIYVGGWVGMGGWVFYYVALIFPCVAAAAAV